MNCLKKKKSPDLIPKIECLWVFILFELISSSLGIRPVPGVPVPSCVWEPYAGVHSREAPLAAAPLHMGIMLLVPGKPSSSTGKNKHVGKAAWVGALYDAAQADRWETHGTEAKGDRCAKIVLNRQELVLTRLACMITQMALIYFFTTIISFRIWSHTSWTKHRLLEFYSTQPVILNAWNS